MERIVYLGGIAPAGPPSPHLRSRLEVERILLDAVPGSTALRASIVIGAGSASFRLLVRLVERLRVLPMPSWRANRTQPIDERDVIEYLARTPAVPAAAGRSLDVCGPDVLSYGEMVERIAELMGVGRLPLEIRRVALTPPASAVVAAVTGQPLELVRPLMEASRPRSCRATRWRPHASTELRPPELRPCRGPRARRVGAPGGARGAVVERTIQIAAPPETIYDVVMDPTRLEDWVTIHQALEKAPDGRLKKGSSLTQSLKLAGRKFKVNWTVVENDPRRKWCGKAAGPWHPVHEWSTCLPQMGTARAFPTSTSTTFPAGHWAGSRDARWPR